MSVMVIEQRDHDCRRFARLRRAFWLTIGVAGMVITGLSPGPTLPQACGDYPHHEVCQDNRKIRRMLSTLDLADEAAKQGRLAASVELYYELLNLPNVLMPHPEDASRGVWSHTWVQRRMEAHGPALLTEYSSYFGEVGNQLRQSADRREQRAELEELASRFLFLDVGLAAQEQLLQRELDGAQFFTAGRRVQQWLDSPWVRERLSTGGLTRAAVLLAGLGDESRLGTLLEEFSRRQVTALAWGDGAVSLESFAAACREHLATVPARIRGAWHEHQRDRIVQPHADGQFGTGSWAFKRSADIPHLTELADGTVVFITPQLTVKWLYDGHQVFEFETEVTRSGPDYPFQLRPAVLPDGVTVVVPLGEHLIWLRDGVELARYSLTGRKRPQFMSVPAVLSDGRVVIGTTRPQLMWFKDGEPLQRLDLDERGTNNQAVVLPDDTVVINHPRSRRGFWWVRDGQAIHKLDVSQEVLGESVRVKDGPALPDGTAVFLVDEVLLWMKDGKVIARYAFDPKDTTIGMTSTSRGEVVVGHSHGVIWLNTARETGRWDWRGFNWRVCARRLPDDVIATCSNGGLAWLRDGGQLETRSIDKLDGTFESIALADGTLVIESGNELLWMRSSLEQFRRGQISLDRFVTLPRIRARQP